jgi:hypothetical protein
VSVAVTAAATIDHQTATALEIFRERCEARAMLVANGFMPLIEAVDGMQAAAERQGLVQQYGQDEIQQIMAESFARWRLE